MKDVLEALAITHYEMVLIHQFREGNGHLSRLLFMFMALQASIGRWFESFAAHQT